MQPRIGEIPRRAVRWGCRLAVVGLLAASPAAATVTVVESVAATGTTPTAADNDFTRIDGAVQAAAAGDTIALFGTFDFAESHALAGLRAGSDGVAGTADDNAIGVPPGLHGVTFTFFDDGRSGPAFVHGPGDLPDADDEAFLRFTGPNRGWTISGQFVDGFDGTFDMVSDQPDAFSQTTFFFDFITVPPDLDGALAPGDPSPNFAIRLSSGVDQVVQLSVLTVEASGDGAAGSASPAAARGLVLRPAADPAAYDGLLVDQVNLDVVGPLAAVPEQVVGFDDESLAHASSMTFQNLQVDGTATSGAGLVGFRVSAHSSAVSTVLYRASTVEGAETAVGWLDGPSYTGLAPVRWVGNLLTGNGRAFAVGGGGTLEARCNRVAGNGSGGVFFGGGGTALAEDNWWGCNGGPGAAGCDPVAAGFDTSPWLVLSLEASPSSLRKGGTSTLTARLTGDSAGGTVGDCAVPDGTPVAFAASVGSVSPAVGGTTAGVATATYTAPKGPTATAEVSAQVDAATVALTLQLGH